MTPRVSVVMPVYNGARYLAEALDSIAAQEFRDFELVVIDDASTDESPAMLAARAAVDPRIRIFRNDQNLGIQKSLNRGLGLALGEYVARQDADDVSEPFRLRLEVDALDSDPGAVMVSTDYLEIDERGRVIGRSRRAAPPELIEYLLHFGNVIGGHTQVMFRRDVALRLGGYDESMHFSEDYDLWLRFAGEGRILVLPEAAIRYRIHADTVTGRTSAAERRDSTTRVARAGLSRLLQREVAAEEASAVRLVSGGAFDHAAGTIGRQLASAAKVFRESERIFAARHQDGALRSQAHHAIAARFGHCAAVLALSHRAPIPALRSLAHGMAWSPSTAMRGLLQTIGAYLRARLRRLVRRSGEQGLR